MWFVKRVLLVLALVLVPQAVAAAATIEPLPASLKAELTGTRWKPNCPVPLSGLRVLTVTHWGFDVKTHTGQIVVNANAAAGLGRVFRKLYALHFPIRHMGLQDMYGPSRVQPRDGDVTGSFSCRQAVASPCNGGKVTGNGHWSNHAYGLAIDLNPVENPYVGCGQTRDATAVSYMNRSRTRPGMVTPAVIAAFASIGWGWGGAWTGDTKDYMHFSHNGH
jgi:hypothetical protein